MSENNYPARSPGSSGIRWRIAQGLWCTTGEINFFQFTGGKETNRSTVRRPEWLSATFGSGNWSRIE